MLPFSRARLFAALALGLLSSPFLLAGPENQGKEELKKEYYEYKNVLNELFNGETTCDPRNETHRKAIDFEARWILYRIYNTEYHAPTSLDPKEAAKNDFTITHIFGEYTGDLRRLARDRERTKETGREYSKAVIERGTEVLKAPGAKPIAIANAARALAYLAELGQPELADALVPLIQSPPQNNQGAQYWAFKGLSDLQEKFPQALKDQRLANVSQALCAFIDKPVTFPKEATEADINGYRILRREAVRALARTRVPDFDDKNLPALTLLKVMTATGMQPAPDIDERVLAATGLARMRPGKNSSYNTDYAVQHIGYVTADLGSFKASVRADANKVRKLPVKMYSSQLLDELDRLRADSKDPYVAKAITQIRISLEKMEADVDPPAYDLRKWLDDAKAPSGQLFKGNSESALKPKEAEPL
jgi:hypothetical protein